MSTLKVLKEYLVGEGGYLLNDDNNGKAVMLSGAWGSGKTHFWLEDIKPKLIEKKQKNIYISLYGRESISELKFEVLKEAYNLEVKDDIISKSASMLSTIAPSLGEKSLVDGFDKLNKKAKEKKAEEILKSGSIICLDDFERKSSKIDLNDLFGYISQLALDYNCKVVIILNSDVFEGEEANVFKTVKEKTVNKYFYFEPTIEELFDTIYNSDEKYRRLDDYKDKILSAIKETEELNARIYIQVLDNCLEWIDKGYDSSGLLALIFTTIQFVLIHKVLDYSEEVTMTHIEYHMSMRESYRYALLNDYHYIIQKMSIVGPMKVDFKEENFNDIKLNIYSELARRDDEGYNIYADEIKQIVLKQLENNEKELSIIWKYGYKLYYMDRVDEETYNDMAKFIKTGILPKKPKKVESSLPLKVDVP